MDSIMDKQWLFVSPAQPWQMDELHLIKRKKVQFIDSATEFFLQRLAGNSINY